MNNKLKSVIILALIGSQQVYADKQSVLSPEKVLSDQQTEAVLKEFADVTNLAGEMSEDAAQSSVVQALLREELVPTITDSATKEALLEILNNHAGMPDAIKSFEEALTALQISNNIRGAVLPKTETGEIDTKAVRLSRVKARNALKKQVTTFDASYQALRDQVKELPATVQSELGSAVEKQLKAVNLLKKADQTYSKRLATVKANFTPKTLEDVLSAEVANVWSQYQALKAKLDSTDSNERLLLNALLESVNTQEQAKYHAALATLLSEHDQMLQKVANLQTEIQEALDAYNKILAVSNDNSVLNSLRKRFLSVKKSIASLSKTVETAKELQKTEELLKAAKTTVRVVFGNAVQTNVSAANNIIPVVNNDYVPALDQLSQAKQNLSVILKAFDLFLNNIESESALRVGAGGRPKSDSDDDDDQPRNYWEVPNVSRGQIGETVHQRQGQVGVSDDEMIAPGDQPASVPVDRAIQSLFRNLYFSIEEVVPQHLPIRVFDNPPPAIGSYERPVSVPQASIAAGHVRQSELRDIDHPALIAAEEGSRSASQASSVDGEEYEQPKQVENKIKVVCYYNGKQTSISLPKNDQIAQAMLMIEKAQRMYEKLVLAHDQRKQLVDNISKVLESIHIMLQALIYEDCKKNNLHFELLSNKSLEEQIKHIESDLHFSKQEELDKKESELELLREQITNYTKQEIEKTEEFKARKAELETESQRILTEKIEEAKTTFISSFITQSDLDSEAITAFRTRWAQKVSQDRVEDYYKDLIKIDLTNHPAIQENLQERVSVLEKRITSFEQASARDLEIDINREINREGKYEQIRDQLYNEKYKAKSEKIIAEKNSIQEKYNSMMEHIWFISDLLTIKNGLASALNSSNADNNSEELDQNRPASVSLADRGERNTSSQPAYSGSIFSSVMADRGGLPPSRVDQVSEEVLIAQRELAQAEQEFDALVTFISQKRTDLAAELAKEQKDQKKIDELKRDHELAGKSYGQAYANLRQAQQRLSEAQQISAGQAASASSPALGSSMPPILSTAAQDQARNQRTLFDAQFAAKDMALSKVSAAWGTALTLDLSQPYSGDDPLVHAWLEFRKGVVFAQSASGIELLDSEMMASGQPIQRELGENTFSDLKARTPSLNAFYKYISVRHTLLQDRRLDNLEPFERELAWAEKLRKEIGKIEFRPFDMEVEIKSRIEKYEQSSMDFLGIILRRDLKSEPVTNDEKRLVALINKTATEELLLSEPYRNNIQVLLSRFYADDSVPTETPIVDDTSDPRAAYDGRGTQSTQHEDGSNSNPGQKPAETPVPNDDGTGGRRDGSVHQSKHDDDEEGREGDRVPTPSVEEHGDEDKIEGGNVLRSDISFKTCLSNPSSALGSRVDPAGPHAANDGTGRRDGDAPTETPVPNVDSRAASSTSKPAPKGGRGGRSAH